MSADARAREWLEGLIVKKLHDYSRPDVGAWVSGGGKAHLAESCINPKTSRYFDETATTGIDCPKCLRAMLADGKTALWASHRVKWLFSARGYSYCSQSPGLYSAQSRRHTEKVVAELRAVAPSDGTLARLADVLDGDDRLAPDTYRMWATRVSVLAALWSYPGYARTSAYGPWSVHVPNGFMPYTVSETLLDTGTVAASLLATLVDAVEAGASYPDAVDGLTWAPHIESMFTSREWRYLTEVPQTLRHSREDFPTTQDWLDAECASFQADQLDAAIVWVRDLFRSFGPGRERMWVTVTVPKALPGVDALWDEYLAWFAGGEVRGKRYAQIPLTVLAMLTRMTRTTIGFWQPKAADPLSQCTLETLVALAGDLTGGELLALYEPACAVTGASPEAVYGTPDLAVRARVRKPRDHTPERATCEGQVPLPV